MKNDPSILVVKGCQVQISNYRKLPEHNSVEAIPCKIVRYNPHIKHLHVIMTSPPEPRIRNDKWFELSSPFGKMQVMSRPNGAAITLHLNKVESDKLKEANIVLCDQFKLSLNVTLIKMLKNNIQI